MKLSAWPVVVLFALVGCHGSSPSTPATPVASSVAPSAPPVKSGPDDPKAVAFLKQAMDTYAGLPAYSAQCAWSSSGDGSDVATEQRSFVYGRPNRFKVVTSQPDLKQTAVCDGVTLLEYSSLADSAATTYQAPDGIATSTSELMGHPSFCGTMLYQLFGGSGNYDHLVDSAKGAATFGAEADGPNGEKTHEVKFYGVQEYGHVTLVIGEKTHFVYKITYDSDPAMAALSDPDKVAIIEQNVRSAEADLKTQAEKDKVEARLKDLDAGKNKPHTSLTTETYSAISAPASVGKATFGTRVPDGMLVNDLTATPLGPPKPPVDLGSVATDFSVVGLDGKKVKLSSYRGHPVMLDFWATWCGPCIAALPSTNHIAAAGAASGLKVLAISSETKDTVSAFVKEKGYKMPTFLDGNMDAARALKVSGLPTTVVIDKDGKIVAYYLGGGHDADIQAALAKVGVTGI